MSPLHKVVWSIDSSQLIRSGLYCLLSGFCGHEVVMAKTKRECLAELKLFGSIGVDICGAVHLNIEFIDQDVTDSELELTEVVAEMTTSLSFGRLEVLFSGDRVSVHVDNRTIHGKPIPQQAFVLTTVPFNVLLNSSSRFLVPVDIGGDDEFEIEAVKRDSENRISSLARISAPPKSRIEDDAEVS
jgi:hypothetical protein